MSVAPVVPGAGDGDEPQPPRRVRLAAAPQRHGPMQPVPEERAWWAGAPLHGRYRDVRDLPEGALDRLVDYYRPFAERVLVRYRSTLAVLVGDPEDVRAQTALWLVEAICEYDAERGVPFAGFLSARLPLFVKPLARSGESGRYLDDSERTYSRVRERTLSDHGREPTTAELAAVFGEDVKTVAERMRAVRMRSALRRPSGSVDVAELAVTVNGGLWVDRPGSVGDGAGADVAVLAGDEPRAVTEALVLAAWHGDATATARPNVRGFFGIVLEFFGGYSQKEIATAGRAGTTSLRAAQRAVLAGTRARLAAD